MAAGMAADVVPVEMRLPDMADTFGDFRLALREATLERPKALPGALYRLPSPALVIRKVQERK